jgi:hypothetical protein
MFEEEFGGFGFEFEGESEDGKFYCDSVTEFQMLSKILPMEEVGISFNGEIKIDEKTSVITDKQIKLENPEVATKTYQKVMEMRELTEVERANINKFKLVLKKIFDVYFRGQKFRRNLCIFWMIVLGLDIATENYFAALMMAACITLYTSPVKFIKEVRKIFSKKKREELSEELSKVNMLGYVNSVDDDEGIKLYFRPGSTNM